MNISRAARMCRAFVLLVLVALLLGIDGCRSHVVYVTIKNRSGADIRNVEVQYPGGSYGRSAIAPGTEYRYPIKVLRPGALLFAYTESSGKAVSVNGPALQPQAEGSIQIEVTGERVNFVPQLQP